MHLNNDVDNGIGQPFLVAEDSKPCISASVQERPLESSATTDFGKFSSSKNFMLRGVDRECLQIGITRWQKQGLP